MSTFHRTAARGLVLGGAVVLCLALSGPVQAGASAPAGASARAAVSAEAGPVAGTVPQSVAATAAARPAGSYVPVPSVRLLDTRTGQGASGPLNGGHELVVPVTARGGIPASGETSIVLNVTVTSPTKSGYLTVYPDGAARPSTANIDFDAGQTVANTVVVRLGTGGRLRFFYGAGAGSVQVVADASGYYLGGAPTAAGTFQTVTNTRIMDTRSGLGGAGGAIASGAARVLTVGGVAGVPQHVRAVVLDVAVVRPAAKGFLTVYPRTGPRPSTSSLNFVAGQTRANLTIVPVSPAGQITLYNSSTRSVDTVADVVGYYLDGYPGVLGSFLTFTAARVLDTTTGLGASKASIAANGTLTAQIGGLGEIPGPGTTSVALNVTVTPTAAGYLSVYPTGAARPATSNISYVPGATVSNLVVVPVRSDGKVVLFNSGPSRTNVQIDVLGVYLDGTGAARCNLSRTDPSGTSITRWNPVVYCVLSVLSQPSSEVGDVDTIIQYESSGDPDAINDYDINAQEGHPSEGLIQVIRPTFDAYRSFQLPNDLYNPAANLYAGLNYAIHRYGSIHDIPGLVSLRNGGGYQGYIVHQ